VPPVRLDFERVNRAVLVHLPREPIDIHRRDEEEPPGLYSFQALHQTAKIAAIRLRLLVRLPLGGRRPGADDQFVLAAPDLLDVGRVVEVVE
jgi:hypothetical protein